ncbi:hypothetical protein E4T49_06566 [Aureobasidium sp. EXF-10728]|nr:hypothetical protein E4T49_06566 [Aureobasidium sp. EXF-10728]
MFTPLINASGSYLPQPYPSPMSGNSLRSPSNFTNLSTLPQYHYSAQIASPTGIRSDSVTSYLSKGTLNNHQVGGFADPTAFSHLPAGTTVPVFNENYGPSPLDMPGAEFISWLFEEDPKVFSPPLQAPYNHIF